MILGTSLNSFTNRRPVKKEKMMQHYKNSESPHVHVRRTLECILQMLYVQLEQ